ncbi:MAG: hypothetical protein EA353_09870, partial [Puniceicoccaceae bacterium]
MEEKLANELSVRYAPYAAWEAQLDLEAIAETEPFIWWRSPKEGSTVARNGAVHPLASYHIALEPGHIGGGWAELEGRQFRIADEDFWVREGELVLEVAQRVKVALINLGAQVSLVRESHHPVNPKTFEDYWENAASDLSAPNEPSLSVQLAHAHAVRDRAMRMA